MLILTGSLAAGLSAVPQVPAAASSTVPAGFKGPYIDLTTPRGNVLAAVRIDANLDESRQKWGSVSGVVAGVRDGEALRDLFGFEVVSVARAWKQPDNSYRVLHREAILYTDLASGDVLTHWHNPYLDETVEVVDVINDPWNHYFAETVKKFAPDYGGLNKPVERPPEPYSMGFFDAGNGMVQNRTHINLYYRAALQPDQWPRESSGTMNRVSEFFTTTAKLADLQNPDKTSVQHTGSWVRVTPWLPWMLMGQTPGHIVYHSTVQSFDSLDGFKSKVLAHTEKHHPHMLEAPPREYWDKPNLSSLEVYARTQKPKPPKKP
ncbi:MAG: DUF1838 family protein [Sinobacteraceae bacterium]|nr:DUF1838 family protein [Nevskiaceae bacterium]MCP5473144.1 DUF1838 family protein [Nevskiaceae bacterium]